MDAQDYVREEPESGQLFHNVDVRGWTPGRICVWLSYTRPVAFYALVKAISRGNISVENQILRLWGIRRSDVASALSSRGFRFSDVLPGQDNEGCSD